MTICSRTREVPFLSELVKYHISGQLKVAPEHCVAGVLDYMGKPHFDVFEKFWDKYRSVNEKNGREQYLVPYLMSSHPGCTLEDAVQLAEFLHSTGHKPEQVQDFYPTPGTLSTCMYYTGIDPRDMTPVFAETTPHGKELQRALLQWFRPDKKKSSSSRRSKRPDARISSATGRSALSARTAMTARCRTANPAAAKALRRSDRRPQKRRAPRRAEPEEQRR